MTASQWNWLSTDEQVANLVELVLQRGSGVYVCGTCKELSKHSLRPCSNCGLYAPVVLATRMIDELLRKRLPWWVEAANG
jgi:hypothetical protein